MNLRKLLVAIAVFATLGLMFARVSQADVILYASTGDTNANGGGRIYTINPVTMTVTLLGDTGLSKTGALDFDGSGHLYVVSGGSAGPAALYTVNTSSAAVTRIGAVTGIQGIDAIAFDSSGTLYAGGWDGSLSTGRLLTVNPSTAGILTNVIQTGTGNALTSGLAFSGGVLYGSRGNSLGHLEDLVTVSTSTGVETGRGGHRRCDERHL